ncbi:hypothetical protein [Azoarcus sp. DN11]|uniref:hypothetical protein n=1 Tax=Azoarcus sp. DN11 TaxID=356837 RepID=UPI000EB230A0|nr:hypothetical protein [Azoarcus sp. DN11]AYH43357.1 hypothetical protein CDA09_08175 [Azoarcus sp. DN11]
MQPAPTFTRRSLTIGRLTMAFSALGMVAATLVAYPYAERFSMGIQIASHLALPISAAFFKIGYVVRLASHHALGNISAG